MKQALCEYISDTLIGAEAKIEVQANDNLLAVGMLDSLQLMRLVQHLETEYGKSIPPADLVLENFESVNAIVSYLENRNKA
ncbi:MAG: acyl carrier protein [Burkholderiaceae bacterium]